MTALSSSLAPVYVGDTTPPAPSSGYGVWLSTAAADVSIPAGPGGRAPVITQDQPYETSFVQEPSVWYYGGKWHMMYSAGAGVAYASAPHPLGPWTKAGHVLGNGQGGYAAAPAHGVCYLEGSTLYYFFVGSASPTRWQVATASADAPTVWTTVPAGTWAFTPPSTHVSGGLGNVFLLKRASGQYCMFYEGSYGTQGWQIGVAVSSSLLGTYTPLQFPITTLRPPQVTAMGNGFYPAGNPWVCEENGRLVMLYGISLGATATEIYRATSANLTDWSVTDQGYPLIRRCSPEEVDQAVDPHLARGPNGSYWAFWSAVDNMSTGSPSAIMAAPCEPALRVFDGDGWRRVSGGDPFAQNAFLRTPATTSNQTGANGRETVYDTTSASRTHTLRRAAQGARERVVNAGPNGGANTVTVNPSGTDTIPNAGSALSVGQVAEYQCYIAGRWSRI